MKQNKCLNSLLWSLLPRHCNGLTNLTAFALLACWLTACSITSQLPKGEVLYTGVSKIHHNKVDTVDDVVKEALATKLEVAPNSSFLGSAYHISPFPVGLWIYNGFHPKEEKGFRYWFWKHFKSDPTLISQVNPELRAHAAEAALKDEGYFNASVDFDTVYDKKDSLKAKIAYTVNYAHKSRLGTVTYMRSPFPRIDSIVHHTLDKSLLRSGDRFSYTNLDAERTRIADVLKDSGYYFFEPKYVKYMADSTLQGNTVNLRVLVGPGADRKALAPCTIDSVHFKLDMGAGLKSRHFDTLRFMTVGWNGPRQQMKTRHLRRSLGFRRHALLTPNRIDLAKELISRLNTFKYYPIETEIMHLAGDSLTRTFSHVQLEEGQALRLGMDTTSVRLVINATYDYPWTGTTEIGAVYKDNNQAGPGATFKAMRRNLFGGGEKLVFQLDGTYEWRTGKHASSGQRLNSYDLGGKVSLSVPRLQIPHYFRPIREKPVSSTYSVSIDWMRRAGWLDMVRASGSVEYGFGLDKYNTMTFTPLKLTYVSAFNKTDAFEEMITRYQSLEHAFEDQFIPQMQVSWTFDNATSTSSRPHREYARVTLAEAGGITDVLMGQMGSHRIQGERQLFFLKFSQFLKATAELRYTHTIDGDIKVAGRVQGGIGYAYGNSTDLPYSEQFYIGGPNSLRGFSVRGIGPGSTTWISKYGDDEYSYLQRVGDIKLEGNVELRFPIAGAFHGALFADAGNVWRLRSSALTQEEYDLLRTIMDDETLQAFREFMDAYSKGEQIGRDLAKQLALDVGVGFRLNLDMFIIRLDIGVPLHDPNEEGGSYFNCRHALLKNLGWNLAVGYPF
ncbi:MAG: BamA/TamA family outer membrane protein [Bacteroidales bacterium]|nr:BamA/TamA family outer membrane protein [Bacteroidales bacterium]